MIGRIVKYKSGETVYEGEVLDKYQGLTSIKIYVATSNNISVRDTQIPIDYYIIRVRGMDKLKHVKCEKIKEVVTYTSVDTGPR